MDLQAWRPGAAGEVLQSWPFRGPALAVHGLSPRGLPSASSVLTASSCEDTSHVGLESTLTASSHSVLPLKALSPQTATLEALGAGTLDVNLGGSIQLRRGTFALQWAGCGEPV